MENKDNKKRFTKFLKKQGFYIALFLCLSVIAVVAAVTTNDTKNARKVAINEAITSKEAKENQKINTKKTQEGSLSQRNKKINNAVEVKNNLKQKKNRSEEHTSELQSRQYLVCRLLLEKNNKK